MTVNSVLPGELGLASDEGHSLGSASIPHYFERAGWLAQAFVYEGMLHLLGMLIAGMWTLRITSVSFEQLGDKTSAPQRTAVVKAVWPTLKAE